MANLLDENGHSVRLWSYSPAQVTELNEQHTNERYVPDFKYSETLTAYSNLTQAIDGADVILFVVPTKAIREVAQQVTAVLAKTHQRPIIVNPNNRWYLAGSGQKVVAENK
ncbi:hypothetical protein WP50_30975 [Lactiplantibacillus plantarum]|nr:hypothetical protein WP50_30975 [Lactiplantibacillus plantarum]